MKAEIELSKLLRGKTEGRSITFLTRIGLIAVVN